MALAVSAAHAVALAPRCQWGSFFWAARMAASSEQQDPPSHCTLGGPSEGPPRPLCSERFDPSIGPSPGYQTE
eukprot:1977720-Pyramimonas_sp.AAC.1